MSRILLVVPAGLTGGLLWRRAPHLPLEIGAAVSLAGLVMVLFASVREPRTRPADERS